jgi:hypothetical protein
VAAPHLRRGQRRLTHDTTRMPRGRRSGHRTGPAPSRRPAAGRPRRLVAPRGRGRPRRPRLPRRAPRPTRVAWEAEDHSRDQDDPLGRLNRTAVYVTETTYGSIPEVEAAVAAVRAAHRPVRGRSERDRPYSAGHPEMAAWVHNVLTDSFLATYQAYGPQHLTTAEADRFVSEQARIGALLDASRRRGTWRSSGPARPCPPASSDSRCPPAREAGRVVCRRRSPGAMPPWPPRAASGPLDTLDCVSERSVGPGPALRRR